MKERTYITMVDCPICGGTHDRLRISPLPEKEESYTHAAACPKDGTIIYVRFDDAEARLR
jgi:hypothetical protein